MSENRKAQIAAGIFAFTGAMIFLSKYLLENKNFKTLSIGGIVLFLILCLILKDYKMEYGREDDLDRFSIPIWLFFSIVISFLVCLFTDIPSTERYLEVFATSFAVWFFGCGFLAIVGIGMGGG